MAGIAAAFAGVSGGDSANILRGRIDPLLAGFVALPAGVNLLMGSAPAQ